MKKRTSKFIVIFITFLTIALVMPSALVLHLNDDFIIFELPDIALSASNTKEPEPGPPINEDVEPESEYSQNEYMESESELPQNELEEPEPDQLQSDIIEPDIDQTQSDFIDPEPDPIVTITISAAGDITLGGCPVSSSYNNFIREFEELDSDLTYYFRNVKHIFTNDDITIVNLEGTLTDETSHMGKAYNFRADPFFAQALSSSGIDIVSLANNHSSDFYEKGYQDTIDSLETEGVSYFGNKTNTILEVNGIKVGLFGFLTWVDSRENRNNIVSAIEDLQGKGADLIIAYFHWGIERDYRPNSHQRDLGRFTIDNGADLVLGAHPHVIQGIEVYKSKNIVYSLANFCFGGNRIPFDMDTFIFQQTFTFENGVLQNTNETNIIPARTTSARTYNNYQPTPVEGNDSDRILEMLDKLSNELNR